jgi:hypothetical protein
MHVEITSDNPIVKAILTGTAPHPVRLAAARGILPLPQADLLEVLVGLTAESDVELSAAAVQTLASQTTAQLRDTLSDSAAAPRILSYFADLDTGSEEIHEAVISNSSTPDAAVASLARRTNSGHLLEIISLNQQRLIRTPQIIDAIVANPYRTAEAERRATEIKREFFEKERGAQQIASELRAQGREAAAEFIENAGFAADLAASNLTAEDALLLANHIETADAEIDDSWMSVDLIEEIYEETEEQRAAIVNKILGELKAEDDEISGERISMINRILRMNMRDRVKLASKGDREARNVLIRDPNRVVAQAVMQNPRITEQEVEKIAAMRTVPAEVLRQIAIGRQWQRSYTIIHNLARNPRTPLANVMSLLTRLQLRDLIALTKNRNVSDSLRRQALRIAATRRGT